MTEENIQTTIEGGADTVVSGADTTGGGDAKTWYDGFAAEDVGFIQNKKWEESPAKVLNSYKELEKFVGAPAEKLIKLPDDLNDSEAMKSVYKRLGVPDEVGDSYSIGDVPEGVQVNEAFASNVAKAAHAAGISPAQYKTVYGEMVKAAAAEQTEAAEAAKLAGEAELAGLKKEWGAVYPEREALAQRAAKAFGASEDLLAQIEGKEKSAGLIKLFANIGAKIGEDKFVETDSSSREFGKTPEQYRADRDALKSELMTDPERRTKYLEGKGADFEKMKRLDKIIAGL